KNTAEIKRAATDFLPKHFEHWRIRQIMAQQFLSSLDPFTRHPLLPHTEKFRVFGRKKKMCHQLERFALIPEDLRRLCDWRFGQTRDHTALLDRHRTRRCDYAPILPAKDNPANL